MHNHHTRKHKKSGIYTVELKTTQSKLSNAVKTSHSFNPLISRLILKNKKPFYTLKLKNIRCVDENDMDFRGEVNAADTSARAKNFNIYLKGLDFLGYATNEILLYTYSLTLPQVFQYNLYFHRGDLTSGGIPQWFFLGKNNSALPATGYDNAAFQNKYVPTGVGYSNDIVFRFKVITFSGTTGIEGKTGYFSPITASSSSSGFIVCYNVTFDDGSSALMPNAISPYVNKLMVIQMFEWYGVSEPNPDDNFNQEFTFKEPTDDMINLQIEYRDIETNQVLTSIETNNESLPDMDFHFEIS